MKHEDAMGAGFFQEGNVEIIKSVCAVHQFPPNSKTGEQSAKFCAARFTIKRLGDDWSDLESEEDNLETVTIRLGNLDKIRPGNLDNPDDLEEEPTDLGDEIDTEGNSIYGEEGAKLFGSWGAFEESLNGCNFKPGIIERCYLPDLEGMKCHLEYRPSGRKYTAKDGTQKEETNLLCTSIQKFPYDKKAKGAAKSKAAGKKGKQDKDEADVMEILTASITDPVVPGLKAVVKSGTTSTRKKFQMQVQMDLLKRGTDKSAISEALAVLKDDDQLTELAGDIGFAVDGEDVSFP
jgi:hypothetical protein